MHNENIEFQKRHSDPHHFLQTCDGGDPGTQEHPSVWVLGIEPGWSKTDEQRDKQAGSDRSLVDALDRYSVELQLTWPFNQRIFKLLAEIAGRSLDDYREFAEESRPFEKNSNGYFKGNIYPHAANNVGSWDESAKNLTGFDDKDSYRAWTKETRLPIVRQWIERSRPKIIIGIDASALDDFKYVTSSSQINVEKLSVNGHNKYIRWAIDGTAPLVVIPHLTGGSNGLNSDESIRMVAKFIRRMIMT